jgi:hypothetical protein
MTTLILLLAVVLSASTPVATPAPASIGLLHQKNWDM